MKPVPVDLGLCMLPKMTDLISVHLEVHLMSSALWNPGGGHSEEAAYYCGNPGAAVGLH